MSGKLLRRAGALLAACAVGVLLGPGAPVAQAQAAAPQPVEAYGSCLNGQRSGDLLLLIDESGSLRKTDPGPDTARVKAANYLLSQLAGQTEQAKITLDVQVAGFASNFDRDPGAWTPLTAANLPGLMSSVNGFAQRDTGQDTDYWLALEGARRSLADHSKEAGAGEAGRCQAIAWFSDGRLDIEPRTTGQRQRDDGTTVPYADGADLTTQAGADQAEQAAATSLCRPGGQADQLRTGHIVMFGIGLAPPGTPDGEFDLMRSITTGAPYQGQPCGAITQPPPGTFTPASDVDDLLFAFDGILGTPDIPSDPTAICAAADTSCRGHEFVLDESIDGFRILGQADGVPGLTAELIGPDGVAHPLSVKDVNRTTDLSFGTVRGSYTWQTDRTVSIQISNDTRQPAGWTGLWALRFVDPNATASSGTSKTNIRIWGNIVPDWIGKKDALPSGAPVTDVRVGLFKEADNATVAPDSLRGTFGVDVDLVDPSGKVTSIARDLDRSTIGNPLTLDLTSVQPGPATLRLSLNLTTAPATRPGTGESVPGTTLSTQYKDVGFRVEPPLGYPSLATRIDFGSVEGETDLTGALTATGPGCVWVPADAAPKIATTPDGVSRVTITADGATSPQTCLSLGDGEARSVTLHLSADHTGNGTASGTLPVSIAPRDRPDQVRTVDVAFTGDLRTPINPVNFWATLIVALLLGPGIPLALLYLFKWATARIPARGLYAQLIPVTVAGGRTLRDNVPFGFREGDFVNLADIPSGGARRLVVGDVTLRTRIGASPFGSGYVSVEPANPRTACLSPGESQPHGYKLTSRLPLAVHRNWVVLHDPAGPADAARVLVLVGSDMSAVQREAFATEIAERLPEVLERLRATLDQSANQGRPPSGGPSGTGSEGPHHGSSNDPAPTYGPAGGTATYGPPGGTAGGYAPGGAPPYPAGGLPAYGSAPSYGPAGTSAYHPGGVPSAPGPAGDTRAYGAPTVDSFGHGDAGPGGPNYGAPVYGAPDLGSAPPFRNPGTPYGEQYGGRPGSADGPATTPSPGAPGPGQTYGAPGPPTYGAPSYGPPGPDPRAWDGRFGDDDGPGSTRPLPDGDGRGPEPDRGPDRGPSYGPRS